MWIKNKLNFRWKIGCEKNGAEKEEPFPKYESANIPRDRPAKILALNEALLMAAVHLQTSRRVILLILVER